MAVLNLTTTTVTTTVYSSNFRTTVTLFPFFTQPCLVYFLSLSKGEACQTPQVRNKFKDKKYSVTLGPSVQIDIFVQYCLYNR